MAGEEEEDIVKTETAKLKAKIEELQKAVSENEAAAKAAHTPAGPAPITATSYRGMC